VHVPSFLSHLHVLWEEPLVVRFLERLASFSRLILFEKRGTGLSDSLPLDALPTFEERSADIVSSTERASELGDRVWSDLLETFLATVRGTIQRFDGREVDAAGDGIFSAFDGPARAVRCGSAICDRAHEVGIELRVGVHTGECERVEDRLRGVAVHIGARGQRSPSRPRF
jgi:hypothetical protein